MNYKNKFDCGTSKHGEPWKHFCLLVSKVSRSSLRYVLRVLEEKF